MEPQAVLDDPMKIYFCDGCNESVPLGDIQAGEVTTIQGKLFCRNCVPPGVVAAPVETAAASGRGTNPLLVLLLVALVAWTAWRDWPLLTGAATGPETAVDVPLVTDSSQKLESLEAQLMQLRQDGGQRSRDINSFRAGLGELQAADANLARSIERLGEDIDRLARTQAESGRLIETIQLTANKAEALRVRLDLLSDSVEAHELALSMGIPTGGVAASGPAAEPVETEVIDPERAAEMAEIKRQLQHSEAGERFEGVDRADAGEYTELAPEIVRLIRDEDLFVRLHAMNVLAKFGYDEAAPELFDALEDGNAHIRKVAAESLVTLLGYDPGFDPKGTPGERSRAIARWRDWYASR